MAQQSIQTNLVGQQVRFDKVPNVEMSEQVGRIRGVYKATDGLVYAVQLPNGRLIECTASWFTVLGEGLA